MRQRCTNPKATNYSDYGGRGISVDSYWEKYECFREWALQSGYTDYLSIERRDVNGHYCPQNCYWTTSTVQACNKRKRENMSNPFIGVAPNKSNWQAYVNYKGVRTNLGTYSSPEEAAKIRDSFVISQGLPHKLNF